MAQGVVGKIFGNVTIIRLSKRQKKHRYYIAICSCGNEFESRIEYIKNIGKCKECYKKSKKKLVKKYISDGKKKENIVYNKLHNDLSGKTIGDLKVIGAIGHDYECLCRCGRYTIINRTLLITKHRHQKTCGKCRLLKNEKPELLNEWDYKKNQDININDITIGMNKKVWWICKNGHSWESTVSNRALLNRGCPYCNESHGEKLICSILRDMQINYTRQKKFEKCKNIKPLSFDFYLKDYHLCIEFHGRQHYESVDIFGGVDYYNKVCENDNIKRTFCQDNKIRYIEIGYWEIDNLNNIIRHIIYQQ